MMKKITSLIIVLAMLVTTLFCFNVTSAFAAKPTSGTCGNNVKWNLNTTTGVLTLTGKGATKDYGETALKGIAPWNESRELIKSIVVGEALLHSVSFFSINVLLPRAFPCRQRLLR